MNVNLICFQENLSLMNPTLCARQPQPKAETQPWDCGHSGLPRPPGRNGGNHFPNVAGGPWNIFQWLVRSVRDMWNVQTDALTRLLDTQNPTFSRQWQLWHTQPGAAGFETGHCLCALFPRLVK